MLPASCKLVGDIVKCPGRFNSEPGLCDGQYSAAVLAFGLEPLTGHLVHDSFARDNDVVPLPVFRRCDVIVPPEVPQKVASIVVSNHCHYLLDAQQCRR